MKIRLQNYFFLNCSSVGILKKVWIHSTHPLIMKVLQTYFKLVLDLNRYKAPSAPGSPYLPKTGFEVWAVGSSNVLKTPLSFSLDRQRCPGPSTRSTGRACFRSWIDNASSLDIKAISPTTGARPLLPLQLTLNSVRAIHVELGSNALNLGQP